MRLALLAALCVASGLAAAEAGAPPLDPGGRTVPAAPLPVDESRLDPQQRLQRQLVRLLHGHEERIRDLAASGVGPVTDPRPGDPALDEPLKARERARQDLRQALAALVDRTPAPRRDELDRPASRALPGQGDDALAARNRLSVAECFRELAGGAGGTTRDADDGLAALDGLDAERLSEPERAIAAYLRLWFLCERMRRLPADATADATAEARAAAAAAVRTAYDALAAQHPGSELALTGEALVAATVATSPAVSP